ncbi:two component transcriptional regulator, LuxR family [Chthoniobacter flavus Ellin428]|uniref:Two component transcriptional regulator, LuxR family n=1 Tax=Chthoniobacter flavus Ellin428 TaxID=497964 RepID=B4CYR7_9BACT|nr:response regulator transcription factor [Chthoniobacter flavus]EDY20608.1 two component transcriptional regulator, LuxR family [Chthoniobacter flavus Ellin428]TCO89885.1 LuxR family two component transcriptional regulator [Chthoniobacter flavus]
MPFTLSIVEDDPVIRAGWVKIINRSTGYRCISDYGSAEAALAGLVKEPPDFVLMDINLPGKSGIECTRELKRRLPKLEIVMLTMFDDRDNLFEALRAGASGYLLKRTSPAGLLEALNQLKAGGSPMSPQIARQVVHFFRQNEPAAEANGAVIEKLSARENEILRCLAEGRHYKEIADQLNLSMDTVRTYIRRTYEKLHVHSRTEAVVKYLGR